MCVAVKNHALPVYTKNRIASLLCIFESIIYHCQILYMSCIIVTLHVPVDCVTNNASIRLYQPNFEMHDVHVLR